MTRGNRGGWASHPLRHRTPPKRMSILCLSPRRHGLTLRPTSSTSQCRLHHLPLAIRPAPARKKKPVAPKKSKQKTTDSGPEAGVLYRAIDPRDGAIRYIGQTGKDPLQRFKSHLSSPRPTSRLLGEWVEALANENLEPRFEIFKTGIPDEDIRKQAEAEAVAEAIRAGEPLLNAPYGLHNEQFIYLPGGHRERGYHPGRPWSDKDLSRKKRLQLRIRFLKTRHAVSRRQWRQADARFRRARQDLLDAVDGGNAEAHLQAAGVAELRDVANSHLCKQEHLARVIARTYRTESWSLPNRVRAWRWKTARFGDLAKAPEVPVPLLLQTASSPRAAYEGGHLLREDEDQWFVGVWKTRIGKICLGYHLHLGGHLTRRTDPAELLDRLRDAGVDPVAIVMMPRSFLPYREPSEPAALPAVDADRPLATYKATMTQVAGLLGGYKLPWWPTQMRDPEQLLAWKPGSAVAEYPAIPEIDESPITTIMAQHRADADIQKVLQHVLDFHRFDAANTAKMEIENSDEFGKSHPLTTICRPPAQPPRVRPGADQSEAGWRTIMSRADDDALACVAAANPIHGMKYSHLGIKLGFPNFGPAYESEEFIGPVISRWLERLEPADVTVAARVLAYDYSSDKYDYLVDPSTGIPAVKRITSPWRGVRIKTYAPRRLNAAAPLARILFDETAWIETADGELHIAPQPYSTREVAWGYGGGGPGAMAWMIMCLLDDVNADVSYANHLAVPKALAEFVKLQRGTSEAVTREQLEAVVPMPTGAVITDADHQTAEIEKIIRTAGPKGISTVRIENELSKKGLRIHRHLMAQRLDEGAGARWHGTFAGHFAHATHKTQPD